MVHIAYCTLHIAYCTLHFAYCSLDAYPCISPPHTFHEVSLLLSEISFIKRNLLQCVLQKRNSSIKVFWPSQVNFQNQQTTLAIQLRLTTTLNQSLGGETIYQIYFLMNKSVFSMNLTHRTLEILCPLVRQNQQISYIVLQKQV